MRNFSLFVSFLRLCPVRPHSHTHIRIPRMLLTARPHPSILFIIGPYGIRTVRKCPHRSRKICEVSKFKLTRSIAFVRKLSVSNPYLCHISNYHSAVHHNRRTDTVSCGSLPLITLLMVLFGVL